MQNRLRKIDPKLYKERLFNLRAFIHHFHRFCSEPPASMVGTVSLPFAWSILLNGQTLEEHEKVIDKRYDAHWLFIWADRNLKETHETFLRRLQAYEQTEGRIADEWKVEALPFFDDDGLLDEQSAKMANQAARECSL